MLWQLFFRKGLPIKDVYSQGVCPLRTFCVLGRVFSCGRPHLLGAKNFGFFEIWCVRTDKGVGPVRTLCRQGGGVNFSQFCVDVSYGRSLTSSR